MKRSILFLGIVLMAFNLYGQAGIKIFTKLPDAKFKIVFNGELENTILIQEISFDSLDFNKPHQVIISFSNDSIADIETEIILLKDQVREFEILKKKEIFRKTAKIGRKIGKTLRIGKHDKEGIIYDVFYLEERTKSEFMNN